MDTKIIQEKVKNYNMNIERSGFMINVEKFSELLTDISFAEWQKIKKAVDTKYSCELSKVKIENSQELEKQIKLELFGAIQ